MTTVVLCTALGAAVGGCSVAGLGRDDPGRGEERGIALAGEGAGSCPVDPSGLGLKVVDWEPERAGERYWSSARRFSEVAATVGEPVEVCGVDGSLRWLTRLTCDDGSNPFADKAEAHRARVGNLGSGGRCERIVDGYSVECPERTYDVKIDMYHCTPDEKRFLSETERMINGI